MPTHCNNLQEQQPCRHMLMHIHRDVSPWQAMHRYLTHYCHLGMHAVLPWRLHHIHITDMTFFCHVCVDTVQSPSQKREDRQKSLAVICNLTVSKEELLFHTRSWRRPTAVSPFVCDSLSHSSSQYRGPVPSGRQSHLSLLTAGTQSYWIISAALEAILG